MPKIRVLVDDNFHYMDPDERYVAGEFDTLREALARCRSIVDKDLRRLHQPGMSADRLFEAYTSFGDEPWVEGAKFSAQVYACQRSQDLCKPTVE